MKNKNLLLLAVALVAAAFLNASAIAAQLTVLWDDNSPEETGFAIERATGTETIFVEVGRVGKDVKTFTDTTLAAATAYKYRIRAYNTGGYSDYSNTAGATTLPNPPAAPGNLRVPEPTPLVTVTLKPGGQLMVMAEVAQK